MGGGYPLTIHLLIMTANFSEKKFAISARKKNTEKKLEKVIHEYLTDRAPTRRRCSVPVYSRSGTTN